MITRFLSAILSATIPFIVPVIILAVILSLWPGGPLLAAREGTGLPLPRFVQLRADVVNLRTGPGVQYPVDWVFHRKSLPVEIIAEHDTWRKVRDWQGTQGWVHQSMLDGERTLIVVGSVRTVRRAAESKSPPLARTEPGVIGRLLSCAQEAAWCHVEIKGMKGWLRRVEFWGVYPSEAVK